ncbi:uncharacterized protein LOC105688965 isoform X1 [Athalia rosae]|uniref:uncharacterized protein LOC105688965 isoform X1 n=1 Tax=Athalia rosae TaxID=37344 RepID=UPI0020335A7C|nr:uncharacterized protein LOC105688965 isoform X1 [Athalia rosae]
MAMKEQRVVMYLPMLILILTEVLLMSYGGEAASASEVRSWSPRSTSDALTVDPVDSEPVERRKRGNTYKRSSSRGSKSRLNGPEDQEDNPDPSHNLLVRSAGPKEFFTDLVGLLANAKPTEGAGDVTPSDDTPPAAARESTSDTEGTQPPHRSGREEPAPGKGDRRLWIGTAPTVPTTMTPIIKPSLRPYLLLFIENVNPFPTYEELITHLQQFLDELATLKTYSAYNAGGQNPYYLSNSGLNDNQPGLLQSVFNLLTPYATTEQPPYLHPSLVATGAPSAIGSIINALNPFPSEAGNNGPGSRPYGAASENYGSSPVRPAANQQYPYNPGSGRPYGAVTTASSIVGSIMDALNPFKPTQPPTPPPPQVTERPGVWQFAANWLQPFSKKLSTMGIILSPDLQGNLTKLLGSVQNVDLREPTKRMLDNAEEKSDANADTATPEPKVDLLSPLGPVLNKLSQLRSVINELNPPQGRATPNQVEGRRSISDKKKLARSASGKQLFCQDLPIDYWSIANYALKYHEEYLPWDDAKQMCAQETGNLVLPENDEEWRVLNDHVKGKVDGKELRYHVGFHRKSPAKSWETIYGDDLPYEIWSDDPVYVDPEGELCGGAYYSDYSDYYNGYIGNSCNEPLPFVCQIRIPPDCV